MQPAGTHNDPFYRRASSNTYRRNPPSDSGAMRYAPGSFQQKSTCAVFINMLLHHLHHEWETMFLWKDIINKIQQTLWNGGSMLWEYLEIIFLLVYHQLMDSDPGHHCLGEQQEHSSKPTNTTALQYRASEFSLPFRTKMCLLISLFTSTLWGVLQNPAGRKKRRGTYPAWNYKALISRSA